MSGPGYGPILPTDGPVSSGLIYTFISLESMTDDIDFSDDEGVTYTYLKDQMFAYPRTDARVFYCRLRNIQERFVYVK